MPAWRCTPVNAAARLGAPTRAARYFHPPGEILLAAALGLAMFQGPLLLYTLRAIQAHHREHAAAAQAALADAAATPKHRRSRSD